MTRRAFTPYLKERPVDRLLPAVGRSRTVRRAVLAMSESRLRRELVLRFVALFYRAFNERGELPRALLDPNVTAEQTAAVFDTKGTFHGVEGFEALVGELHEAFGEIRFEPESVIELSPEELLVVVRFHASGGGSGISLSRMLAHRITLRTGNIVRFVVLWETAQALQAAGLSE